MQDRTEEYMKYPKLQTLWKRDEKTHKIIEGDFSKAEFANIRLWEVSEKINGTNIRISYNRKGDIQIDGRTDDAQIPAKLYAYLQNTFTPKLMESVFPLEGAEDLGVEPPQVILFGEGVGAKIKGSGQYLKDGVGFILFDVYIDGWWLERHSIEDIASKLKIPCVPCFGVMTVEQTINLVKSKPLSKISFSPMIIEGIVARSHPQMLFRDGAPIMFKLKCSDYR